MTDTLQFEIGQRIALKVNDVVQSAHIFGYELDTWSKPNDWLLHILLDSGDYPFDIKVHQKQLLKGIKINTNGAWVKVLPNDTEVAAM